MAGKIITQVQQRHIAGVITGLVAALDNQGASWPKETTDDIKRAYQMIGMPCPFSVEPAPKDQPKPGLMQRMKAAVTGARP